MKKQREEARHADVRLLNLQRTFQTPLRFSHGDDALTDEQKVDLNEEIKHYKKQYLKNEPVNRLADAFASVDISGNRNDILSINWKMEVMNYLTRIKGIQNYETKARRTLKDVST